MDATSARQLLQSSYTPPFSISYDCYDQPHFIEMVEMTEEDFIMVDEDSRLQPAIPPIFHLPQLKGHNVFEASVEEIQHLFSINSFTAVENTQLCLDRIQAVNPYLEAVIETNPDALQISAELDAERKEGKARGPLHGIPVLVKDVGVIPIHYYLSLNTSYHSIPVFLSGIVQLETETLPTLEHGNRRPNANHRRIVGSSRVNRTQRRLHSSSFEGSRCRDSWEDEPRRMGRYARK